MKNQRAFTLLEAMVVIAIIGILSAIAIPSLLNALWQQRHIAAGLAVQSALNQAQSSVKKTRTEASVLVVGNRISVYEGCDSCVTNCTNPTLTPSIKGSDTTHPKVTVNALTAAMASPAPAVTGISLNNSTAFASDSGWFAKNGGVCVNFRWGKIGNTVQAPGWLSLRNTDMSKFATLILKSPSDDRFQVWFYNNGTWLKKSP